LLQYRLRMYLCGSSVEVITSTHNGSAALERLNRRFTTNAWCYFIGRFTQPCMLQKVQLTDCKGVRHVSTKHKNPFHTTTNYRDTIETYPCKQSPPSSTDTNRANGPCAHRHSHVHITNARRRRERIVGVDGQNGQHFLNN
jgi:hypothetical protein